VKAEFVVLWVIAPCSVVVGYQRFGVLYCLHLQGRSARSSETPNYTAQQRRKPGDSTPSCAVYLSLTEFNENWFRGSTFISEGNDKLTGRHVLAE